MAVVILQYSHLFLPCYMYFMLCSIVFFLQFWNRLVLVVPMFFFSLLLFGILFVMCCIGADLKPCPTSLQNAVNEKPVYTKAKNECHIWISNCDSEIVYFFLVNNCRTEHWHRPASKIWSCIFVNYTEKKGLVAACESCIPNITQFSA